MGFFLRNDTRGCDFKNRAWFCGVIWTRDPGLPSPGHILNDQIEKEIPISVNIFKKSQQNELDPKDWQEVFHWMLFFSAKLRCKSLSFSLGNQMKIQTAGSVVHSISYLLFLSLTIIISDNHPKDPSHNILLKKKIKFLTLDYEHYSLNQALTYYGESVSFQKKEY